MVQYDIFGTVKRFESLVYTFSALQRFPGGVRLWGREVAKLEWRGGYKKKFGKLGSIISFNPDYVSYGWNLDPIGPYNHSAYMVQQGLSDSRCGG